MVGLDTLIVHHAANHVADTFVYTVSRSCRCAVLAEIAEQVAGL